MKYKELAAGERFRREGSFPPGHVYTKGEPHGEYIFPDTEVSLMPDPVDKDKIVTTPADLELQCHQFNQKYPIGTLMELIGGEGNVTLRTRSYAQVVGGAEAVVLVEGRRGAIAIDLLRKADGPNSRIWMLWDAKGQAWLSEHEEYGFGRTSFIHQGAYFTLDEANAYMREPPLADAELWAFTQTDTAYSKDDLLTDAMKKIQEEMDCACSDFPGSQVCPGCKAVHVLVDFREELRGKA